MGLCRNCYARTPVRQSIGRLCRAKRLPGNPHVADIPTAFIAEFGSGKPIIGILGEFDALPGLSQKVTPTKEVLNPGAAGHGCGHNMFGAASLGGSKRSNHGYH